MNNRIIKKVISTSDINEIWSLIKKQRFKDALDLLLVIPAKEVNDDWYLARGKCLSGLNKHSEAMKSFSEIKRKGKQAYLGLANSYLEIKQYRDAIQTFVKVEGWETDRRVSIGLAHCYQKLEIYDLAIANFQKALKFKDEKTPSNANEITLLNLANCQLEMKQYNLAIQTFMKIKDWEKDRQVSIGLAHCYQKLEKHDLAIENFQKVLKLKDQKAPSNANDVTLLTLAIYYEEMNKYDDAISTYHKISNLQNDKQALLSLARCYEDMGKYDDAISTYHKISNLQNDKKNSLTLARCYEQMGEYKKALLIHNDNLKKWGNDARGLLGLAHCFEKMDRYDDAISTFNKILNLENDKQALLSKARCYEKMDQYKEAENIYYDILKKWKNDNNNQVLLSLALCYKNNQRYTSALETFQKIPDYENNKLALLGIARCYRDNKKKDEAVKAFQKIPDYENDKQALLGLARCYDIFGDHVNALKMYKNAALKFPHCTKIFNCFCIYAINQHHNNALNMLNQAIEKWPHHPNFYLLKANYLYRKKNFDEARNIIEYVIKKFPYYFNGHMALIYHDFLTDKTNNKIEENIKKWSITYKNNEIFEAKLKKVMTGNLLKMWARVEPIILNQLSNEVKVVLPNLIKNEFTSLSEISKEMYLVGSTVQTLLDHKPIIPKQDIDMVIFLQDTNKLFAFGFEQNFDVPNLFTKTITDKQTGENFRVDCFVVNPDQSIDQDALLRDFDDVVYCDKKGKILDPIGRGLQNIHTKTFGTIVPAKESFAKDPVRILRAIKKIVEGYRATDEIIEAIKGWNPQDSINLLRLQAVKKKHLVSLDGNKQEQYHKYLDTYGITDKLKLLKQKAKPFAQNCLNTDKNHTDKSFRYYPGLRTGITLYAYVKERIMHPEDYKEHLSLRKKLPHHLEALDLAVNDQKSEITVSQHNFFEDSKALELKLKMKKQKIENKNKLIF